MNRRAFILGAAASALAAPAVIRTPGLLMRVKVPLDVREPRFYPPCLFRHTEGAGLLSAWLGGLPRDAVDSDEWRKGWDYAARELSYEGIPSNAS